MILRILAFELSIGRVYMKELFVNCRENIMWSVMGNLTAQAKKVSVFLSTQRNSCLTFL